MNYVWEMNKVYNRFGVNRDGVIRLLDAIANVDKEIEKHAKKLILKGKKKYEFKHVEEMAYSCDCCGELYVRRDLRRTRKYNTCSTRCKNILIAKRRNKGKE